MPNSPASAIQGDAISVGYEPWLALSRVKLADAVDRNDRARDTSLSAALTFFSCLPGPPIRLNWSATRMLTLTTNVKEKHLKIQDLLAMCLMQGIEDAGELGRSYQGTTTSPLLSFKSMTIICTNWLRGISAMLPTNP